MENEIWKDVVGYEGLYQVSNQGRLRSLDRLVPHRMGMQFKRGSILAIRLSGNGYVLNQLCCDDKRKSFLRHRLVAEAFIPNPLGLPEVNHLDGNKLNCNDWNLEWCTSSHNKQHGFKTGLLNRKYLHKLTTEEIIEIRASVGKIPRKVLAEKFGVVRQTIDGVINGRVYHNE